MFKTLLPLLIAISTLSSCTGSRSALTTETLEGKEWVLSAVRQSKVSAAKSYIVFGKQRGQVNGNGGCNGFGGIYSTTGNNISIKEIMHTEMACDQLDTENAFFRALESATRYKINNGQLDLYQGRELLITLKARRQ